MVFDRFYFVSETAVFPFLKPGKPPFVAGVGCLIENPDFSQVYFQFYFEGLCSEWVGQSEAFSEIMLQNVMAGGFEVYSCSAAFLRSS